MINVCLPGSTCYIADAAVCEAASAMGHLCTARGRHGDPGGEDCRLITGSPAQIAWCPSAHLQRRSDSHVWHTVTGVYCYLLPSRLLSVPTLEFPTAMGSMVLHARALHMWTLQATLWASQVQLPWHVHANASQRAAKALGHVSFPLMTTEGDNTLRP